MKLDAEQKKIEAKVEVKVKEIINKLKASHEKFEDLDFGPNDKDMYGALSFYGSKLPAPAGSKYPAPETLRWERPQYDDSKFTESTTVIDAETEEEDETKEAVVEQVYDEYSYHAEEADEVGIQCSIILCKISTIPRIIV